MHPPEPNDESLSWPFHSFPATPQKHWSASPLHTPLHPHQWWLSWLFQCPSSVPDSHRSGPPHTSIPGSHRSHLNHSFLHSRSQQVLHFSAQSSHWHHSLPPQSHPQPPPMQNHSHQAHQNHSSNIIWHRHCQSDAHVPQTNPRIHHWQPNITNSLQHPCHCQGTQMETILQPLAPQFPTPPFCGKICGQQICHLQKAPPTPASNPLIQGWMVLQQTSSIGGSPRHTLSGS